MKHLKVEKNIKKTAVPINKDFKKMFDSSEKKKQKN